jgi:hypothetical protein
LFSHGRWLNRRFTLLLWLASVFGSPESLANTDDSVWRKLLITDQTVSTDLTASPFFLTDAPVDPTAEMRALLTGPTEQYKCRFPARMLYLERAGLLGEELDFSDCPKLKEFMSVMDSDSLELVLAGPSVASPMSYFGHIFLKFRKKDDEYFSRTLAFLAPLDSGESMLQITAAGAFSSIPGQYHVAPYHQMISEYIEVDQRPIQTYELDVQPSNKRLLLYHIFELAALNRPYNFFWGNCATRIQELMEIAFPTELGDVSPGLISPQSLIRVLRNKDLIVRSSEVPARSEALFAAYHSLPSSDQKGLKALLASPDKAAWVARNGNDLLPLAKAIYQRQFRALGAPPADYSQLMSLPAKPLSGTAPELIRPERPRLLEIGWLNDPVDRTTLRFRPGLFDRSFDSLALATESRFRYLDTTLSVRNENVSLEKLDLLALAATKKRSIVERPLSWGFTAGWSRAFDGDRLNYQMRGAIGMAWGGTQTQFSVMPTLTYFSGEGVFPSLAVSASLRLDQARLSAEIDHFGASSNERPRNRRRLAVSYELDSAWTLQGGIDQVTQGVDVALSRRF